ncbi:MAG: transcriptional regulator FtsR [Angustibacter sp.]
MNQAVSRRDSAMSIGEVIAVLNPEFPDVSVSKLRLWEAEGLVEPARSPSGYRRYTRDDVERLRYAMALQRDYYWPLRRIRGHLEAVAQGLEDFVPHLVGPRPIRGRSASSPAPSAASSTPTHPHDDDSESVRRSGDAVRVGTARIARSEATDPVATLRPGTRVRLSAAEVCTRADLAAEQLDELVSFGLLAPGGAGWYDESALAIAVSAGELARYGFEPRHLRAFRAAADREVGLVEQVVGPLRAGHGQTSHARAQATAHEVSAAALRLHAALVRVGLLQAGLG